MKTESAIATTAPSESKRRENEWHALLWGVKCSIRYHNYRVRWFRRLRVWTDFLVILSGGTVLSSALVAGNYWTAGLGAVVSILSTLDLVIGYGEKARDYVDLAKEFYDLQQSINKIGGNPTEVQLHEMKNRRLEIEKYEPPHLRNLNIYCHNELVRAGEYGDEQIAPLTPLQIWCKNWWDLNSSKPKKNINKNEPQRSPRQE